MPRLPPWRPVAHRPPELVLHISLVLEWSLIVRRTQYATDLSLKMSRLVSAVPTLWSRHLTEVLLGEERAGRITTAKAEQGFAAIYPFQIVIDPETPALAWTDILDLAQLHSVSIDDAAYLELALRLNLPLATTDATLIGAGSAAGIPIFTP